MLAGALLGYWALCPMKINDITFTPGCKIINPANPAGDLSHFDGFFVLNQCAQALMEVRSLFVSNMLWPNTIFTSRSHLPVATSGTACVTIVLSNWLLECGDEVTVFK